MIHYTIQSTFDNITVVNLHQTRNVPVEFPVHFHVHNAVIERVARAQKKWELACSFFPNRKTQGICI